MIEKTLGGNRLGSGSQMKVKLHNFERSTHNQSRDWMSTMACGYLYPCFKELGTNGDKFEIDIDAGVITQPTIGPMFGTFKFQIDIFAIPLRLYCGALHNNVLNVGTQMNKVLFPTGTIDIPHIGEEEKPEEYIKRISIKQNSLMAYLGLRNLPTNTLQENENAQYTFNALPVFAYYDIVKNYYSNKQEKYIPFIDLVQEGDKYTWNNAEWELEYFDNAKRTILKNNELNTKATLGECDEMYEYNQDFSRLHSTDFNGLCVKTYQSDLFNNWLSEEYGANLDYISQISSATIDEGGKLSMDVLNMSQKIYNMLNRIAVGGSTYDDWQEAVYSEQTINRAENPIYCGGFSSEVGFEEIISMSATSDQPLGSLAGKGISYNKKGGKIVINCVEPTLIMGICSLTPRISYSQGNNWMLDLISMDDLHKPSLDGIGFQDLMTYWMHGNTRGTRKTINFPDVEDQTRAAGKQPAWIHYMTAIDENYSEFSAGKSLQFMTLDRNYNLILDEMIGGVTANIKDLTTYIQPDKYNYAFADTSLTAENFWTKIRFNVRSRRKMSAKLIPNL